MNLIRFLCLAPLTFALSTHAGGSGVSTNKTDSIEDKETNAPTELGPNFTNSVDMELVKISGNLWAGKYEVTQAQYQKITGGNPSAFGGGSRPVDSVSYSDALDFCQKMTDEDNRKKMIPIGSAYDLPTEDEWKSLMADATVESAVTSIGAAQSGTSAVGSLAPNSLGLYDTRGNVMEFVKGDDKAYRVLKGGSWQDHVEVNLRPDFRNYCKPEDHLNTFGFRCVLRAR